MVSARSTVSIARTTPAQKPLGEQRTIFRGGLADIWGFRTGLPRIRAINNGVFQQGLVSTRTWDGFWALSRPGSKPLRHPPRTAYIGRNSRLYRRKYRLRLKNRRAKRKGDLP